MVAIPVMDVIAASMAGRHPTDYKLWEVFYILYFIGIVFL